MGSGEEQIGEAPWGNFVFSARRRFGFIARCLVELKNLKAFFVKFFLLTRSVHHGDDCDCQVDPEGDGQGVAEECED